MANMKSSKKVPNMEAERAKFQTPWQRAKHPPPNGDPPWLNVSDEPKLFEQESEWQGMPEFIQGKQREYAKIIVRFRNQEDLNDFARLIGQTLNAKSQCTWHPKLLPKKVITKYVDE